MSEQLSLSQAIRLGAMLKPQAFEESYGEGKTCTLQAACEALGRDAAEWSLLPCDYPFLNTSGNCPSCDYESDLERVAYHLNDDHRWTREAIAEWLEPIEAKLVESIEAAHPVEKREEVGA